MSEAVTEIKRIVSASPHQKSPLTVPAVMLNVVIALIPAMFTAVLLFGFRALAIIAVCVGSCVLFEFLSRKIMKRKNTIGDFSAVVTGVLLAFNMPPTIPLWMCVVGAFVAVVIVKQFFGGIGQNFANPAITARIVMLVSFASAMSGAAFTAPQVGKQTVDVITSATPLQLLSGIDRTADISAQISDLQSIGELPDLLRMLFGVRGGCIGETCAVALLLGGIYLIARGIIKPTIPVAYIGTVGVFMLIASHFNVTYTLYELMGGGLILGAFFMATDYATSPINRKGKILFGIGCGLLTAVIRLYGSLPEGVSYSVLLMNIACPLIEKITQPKYFGFVKPKKEKKAKEEAV